MRRQFLSTSQTTSPTPHLDTRTHERAHYSHQHGAILLRHARVALVNAQALEAVEGLSTEFSDGDVRSFLLNLAYRGFRQE